MYHIKNHQNNPLYDFPQNLYSDVKTLSLSPNQLAMAQSKNQNVMVF